MPLEQLERADLKAGDILIFYDLNPISILQAMHRMFIRIPSTLVTLGLNTFGRANAIRGHWSAYHTGIISSSTKHSVALTHAVKSGVVTISWSSFRKSYRGSTKVFRLIGHEQYALRAAEIASIWGPDDLTSSSMAPKLSYGKTKIVKALWHQSYYGKKAKYRAQHYYHCAKLIGGPTQQRDTNRKTKMFCSMLIGACYHAALWDKQHGDIEIRKCMKLDPQNAYPSTLDGYLKQSPRWRCVGSI